MDQTRVPLIYLLAFLFVEVMITATFVELFGGFALFVEIVLSAVAGIMLIATIKEDLIEQARSATNIEFNGIDLIQQSTIKFIAGVLLVIPGVFTDLLAIVIQLPIVGKLFRIRNRSNQTNKGESDVIDVEVIDSNYIGSK